jgi:hypothetical protein
LLLSAFVVSLTASFSNSIVPCGSVIPHITFPPKLQNTDLFRLAGQAVARDDKQECAMFAKLKIIVSHKTNNSSCLSFRPKEESVRCGVVVIRYK